MDEVQTTRNPKKNLIILGVTAFVIILVIVALFIFLRRPGLISPLAESGDDLRVIFVSPESSSTLSASPSASASASPSSAASSRPTPKATSVSTTTPSPRSTPATTASPNPRTSPSSRPSPTQ